MNSISNLKASHSGFAKMKARPFKLSLNHDISQQPLYDLKKNSSQVLNLNLTSKGDSTIKSFGSKVHEYDRVLTVKGRKTRNIMVHSIPNTKSLDALCPLKSSSQVEEIPHNVHSTYSKFCPVLCHNCEAFGVLIVLSGV